MLLLLLLNNGPKVIFLIVRVDVEIIVSCTPKAIRHVVLVFSKTLVRSFSAR